MILIQIAGHLGADPETRFTPNGQKVTSLRVATNIRRGGKEKTVWWKVTLWGDRFDRKLPYLKKGSAVFLLGEMGIPEIYQDREGNPQISLEIIAEYVGFNPFGGKGEKGEKGNQEQGQDEEQEQGGGHSMPYSGQNNAKASNGTNPYQAKSPANSFANSGFMQKGAGTSAHSSMNDDDIPF